MESASNGYKNIVRRVADILNDSVETTIDKDVYNNWHKRILDTVSDNLKTAEALVIVQQLMKDASVNSATKIALIEFIDRLLGLQFLSRAKQLQKLESVTAPAEIIALADARAVAKAAKDWATADALRAKIDAAGWTAVDTKDGTKLVKKA